MAGDEGSVEGERAELSTPREALGGGFVDELFEEGGVNAFPGSAVVVCLEASGSDSSSESLSSAQFFLPGPGEEGLGDSEGERVLVEGGVGVV